MSSYADRTQPPPLWRFTMFLAGLAICGVSQWYIFQRTDWFWSSWGLVVGAVIAAVGIGRPRSLDAVETPPSVPAAPSRRRRIAGIAATVIGCSGALFGSWLLSTSWRPHFEIGFLLTIAGTVLFCVGLGLLDGAFRKQAEPLPWLRWEIAAFVAIVLLGLFLRFHNYDFPPFDGVCAVEEPQSGQGALAIRRGDRPWEFLLDRWVALLFMNWLGDTITAIRIPFTILSWVTLIPFYLLMRELVSRPAALLSTLFFAFCRWHLAYARSAHNIFGPTLPLILLALFLTVRVYRRGGLAAYPMIGLICAYTLYTYAGYRGTTLFIGLFCVISLIQHLWAYRHAVLPSRFQAIRSSFRGQILGIGLAAFGFGLLLVPLYSQLSTNPTYFLEAAERATNNDQYYSHDTARMLQQRIDRTRDAAMMFNHLGDGSAVFNMPGRPQLDPVSGTLLVLGLVYCLIWAGVRMQGFFAVYFLVLLAFGTVFVHNFDIRRLQGVIPLIFILAGFFFDASGHFVRRRLGRYAIVPLVAAASGMTGLAFAENYNLYFRDMMSSSTVRQAFHTNYTIAIRYYHDMPDDGYLQLISDMPNFFEPSDYEWWRGNRLPGDTSHDLLPLLTGKQGPWQGRVLHLLIRMPTFEGEALAELVRERFPNAQCNVWRHPDGPIWAPFMECLVGPDSYGDGRGFSGGVHARYFRGGSLTPIVDRLEPAISYGLVPDECHYPTNRLNLPCKATWEGIWAIEQGGTYQLMANTRSGSLRVFVDDRPIGGSPDDSQGPQRIVETSLDLAAGPHRIRIESNWSEVHSVGTQLLFRRGGESNWKLLEFWDLAEPSPGSVEGEAPPAAAGDDSAGAPEPPA